MTALAAVAAYLPPHRVAVDELAVELGLTAIQAKLLQRHQGLAEVRRDPRGSLLDLLLAAAEAVPVLRETPDRVRYVLYARTFPVVVPFPLNPLHELCRRVGLTRAVAFTVSHHSCATGLLAVTLAGRLLAADADDRALALVLAGEKTFTRDAQVHPGISLFAEGAGACVVRSHGERDVVLSYVSRAHRDGDLNVPDVARRFEPVYPDALADIIRTAAARAGLALTDIDVILPHNVNVACWQRACRRLGIPIGRVLLDNVAAVGHAFCADMFVNYGTARERGILRPGRHYLVAAAGVARDAVFSAMVLRH